MIFPVHYYVPGVEHAVCFRGAFTEEECDKIVNMCELQAHKQGGYETGLIGPNGQGRNDPEIRVTDLVWLHPTRENDWIHNRISAVTGRVNFDKFQLDLTGFEGFQYSVYDGKKKGHYGWHIDMVPEPANPGMHRKLSLSVMLTDPETYEGGDLLMNDKGNPDKAQAWRPKKGDVVFFYSFVPHAVTPVTKGIRRALVTWACGEKFR